MKLRVYGGLEVQLHSLALALDEGSDQFHVLAALPPPPGKDRPVIQNRV
jgi:hypothetical protein